MHPRSRARAAGRARHRPAAVALAAGLVAALVVAAPTAARTPPAAPVAAADEALPQRYLDPVFDDVVVSSDLTYGAAMNQQGVEQSLELDLYEPAGDELAARPVIVWIHGGSFAYGSKTGSFDVQQGRELARRGFVVASIEYRLASSPVDFTDLFDPVNLEAITFAWEDARAAIAWLRQHAGERRIDPEVVLAAGYSAGGVTAANLSGWTNEVLGRGTPTDPSHVDGVIPYAGATLASSMGPEDPPLLWFHGTADPVVPYSVALGAHQAALTDGVDSTMVAKSGATHDLSAHREEFRETLGHWAHERWLAPLPTVDSVTPRAVPSGAPAALHADWTGAGTPTAVELGGVPVAPDTTDGGVIELTAPALPAGFVDVAVETRRGRSVNHLGTWVAVVDVAVRSGPPPFTDVGAGHVFAAPVAFAAATGLSTGRGDGTFGPGEALTRQGLATFFYRAAGSPRGDDPACDEPPFDDVPTSSPFCGEITWARDTGLVAGDGGGRFAPTAVVTRQALAAVLHGAGGRPPVTVPDPPTFSDVDAEHLFVAPVEWSAASGLVKGYADGRFGATDPVRRAELVAVLHNHFGDPATPD